MKKCLIARLATQHQELSTLGAFTAKKITVVTQIEAQCAFYLIVNKKGALLQIFVYNTLTT